MVEIPSQHTFEVTIVSAHGKIFSGTARMVSLRSTSGELGILPHHSALMTLLRPGEVRIHSAQGDIEYIYVSGGFVEVQPTELTVLADTALRADQIDEAAAQKAKENAEETMRTAVLFSDRDAAHAELIKALAQLQTLADARKKRNQP